MVVYAEEGSTTFDLGLNLTCWGLNFFDALAGLFISLFMLVSHDDLETGLIEPLEMSNNLN